MTTRLGFLVLVYFSILHEQTSIISTISCDLLLIEQSTSSSANKWHENWHEQANRLGPQNGAQSVATAAAAASSISRTKSEEPPPISLEDSSSSSSSSSGKIEKINKTTTMPPPPTCHGDELSASNLKHHQHHHKRRHRLRRRRQARDISSRDADPEQVIARPPVSWSSRDRNTTIKLAALATKLQQWLHCNRLNLLAQLELKQQVGTVESSTSATSSTVSTTSSTATTTSTITTTTTTESTDQEQHQHHHHHEQSLSKIIDDGQAAGAAGAATSAAPVGSSTSSQNIELENTGGTTAFCPAHFDGHLCWPKAKLGQQIQLPCPRINYYSNQITGAAAQSSPAAQAAPPTTVVAVAPLTSNEIQLQQAAAAAAAAPPATTTSQKQQLEEQLKPVLESIEKVQANKSATATQDDDASSLHQSIKQPVASGQVLELAAEDKTTTPPTVTTNDAINQQPATSKEFDLKLKLEQEEHKRWLSVGVCNEISGCNKLTVQCFSAN